MVVGSTMNDVLQVTNTPSAKELQEEEKAAASKEPLSTLKVIYTQVALKSLQEHNYF